MVWIVVVGYGDSVAFKKMRDEESEEDKVVVNVVGSSNGHEVVPALCMCTLEIITMIFFTVE